jgi:hypothetical protein
MAIETPAYEPQDNNEDLGSTSHVNQTRVIWELRAIVREPRSTDYKRRSSPTRKEELEKHKVRQPDQIQYRGWRIDETLSNARAQNPSFSNQFKCTSALLL